ncbi:MAG: hypothetical protein JO364_08315 [Pseudonocardiales bacterium]|nr:hypothetical protein [Pseudonocardiales bacterium]
MAAGEKPPRGTGAAGKALWAAVATNFVLESHELEVLAQVAMVADRIDALDKAVTRDGVLVDGRAHPALIESRLQRVTLGRLLAVLRLPDREDHRPQRRGGFRKAYQIKQVLGGA